MDILMIDVVCLPLLVCFAKYILDFPVHPSDALVGKKLRVLRYNLENGIAELIDAEYFCPHKKNKGQRYYIPHYYGILRKGEVYKLLKKENGELYFIPV